MMANMSDKVGQAQLPMLRQNDLLAFLSTQPDVAAAYLFGSLAEGRAAPRSDVDIAILLGGDPDSDRIWERRLALWDALERFTDCKLDLIILNQSPPLLQNEVLQHGRLLYEGDRAARVEFEVRAGKVYADLKPMNDFFTQVLFQEIKEVGLGGRRRHRVRTPHTVA